MIVGYFIYKAFKHSAAQLQSKFESTPISA